MHYVLKQKRYGSPDDYYKGKTYLFGGARCADLGYYPEAKQYPNKDAAEKVALKLREKGMFFTVVECEGEEQ